MLIIYKIWLKLWFSTQKFLKFLNLLWLIIGKYSWEHKCHCKSERVTEAQPHVIAPADMPASQWMQSCKRQLGERFWVTSCACVWLSYVAERLAPAGRIPSVKFLVRCLLVLEKEAFPPKHSPARPPSLQILIWDHTFPWRSCCNFCGNLSFLPLLWSLNSGNSSLFFDLLSY